MNERPVCPGRRRLVRFGAGNRLASSLARLLARSRTRLASQLAGSAQRASQAGGIDLGRADLVAHQFPVALAEATPGRVGARLRCRLRKQAAGHRRAGSQPDSAVCQSGKPALALAALVSHWIHLSRLARIRLAHLGRQAGTRAKAKARLWRPHEWDKKRPRERLKTGLPHWLAGELGGRISAGSPGARASCVTRRLAGDNASAQMQPRRLIIIQMAPPPPPPPLPPPYRPGRLISAARMIPRAAGSAPIERRLFAFNHDLNRPDWT